MNELQERLDKIQSQLSNLSSSEERLTKIKEAMMKDGIVDKARTDQLSNKVSKVLIHKNGDIDIYFSIDSLLEFNNLRSKETDSESQYYIVKKHHDRLRPEIIRKRQQADQIYNLMKENPNIRMIDIQKIMNLKEGTAYDRVKLLRAEGRIAYVHKDRNGRCYWQTM
jgi:predicted transcriptional regulator